VKTIHDPRYVRLIEHLKARRLALRLDQAAVAGKLGHTNRWLSKVETMEVRLDVMTFIRVCGALGVRASRLVQKVEKESEESDPSSYGSHRLAGLLHYGSNQLNSLQPIHKLVPRPNPWARHTKDWALGH